jgi:hypothetical protein
MIQLGEREPDAEAAEDKDETGLGASQCGYNEKPLLKQTILGSDTSC